MPRLRIAHVSDLHCTRDGVFEPATFQAGVEAVNALAPDVVVASGDLTDWGLRPEFEKARDLLARFEAPALTCLGNHDARREGWRVYEEVFRPRFYHERVLGVDFLVLDSSQPDLDEGEVGRAQRAWLADRLRECEFPVVVLHHHAVPIPNTGRDMNVLRDAGGLLYVLDSFDVPLVLGGHRHYPWAWELNNLLIAHAGTFSSNKRNWPAGFNSIDVDDACIRVRLHHFLEGETRDLGQVPLPDRWGGDEPRRLRQVHEGGLSPVAGGGR